MYDGKEMYEGLLFMVKIWWNSEGDWDQKWNPLSQHLGTVKIWWNAEGA